MNKAQQEYLEGILLRNTVHFPKGHTLTSSFDCLAYHDIHPIILHIIALGASEDSEQVIEKLRKQINNRLRLIAVQIGVTADTQRQAYEEILRVLDAIERKP